MNDNRKLHAYKEARKQVEHLRSLLADYTGSCKPYDGVPTGAWLEGVTGANQELIDIRTQLETALENLSVARLSLNQQNLDEDILEEEKYTTVNLGVLLEGGKDRDWFRTVLSHDPSLDYIIDPGSVERFFDYIIHLGKQGKRVKWLVLMGHGSRAHAQIGRLMPSDIDICAARKILSRYQELYDNTLNEIASLEKQLEEADNEDEKKGLTQQLDNLQIDVGNYEENIHHYSKKVERLESLTEAMAKDAIIGLLNCYPAGNPAGRQMMRNLGKVFLEKRGGRVVGCDGLILILQHKPLITWITGAEDINLLPLGTMREIIVRPFRCGVPCLHFERYGYCDNRKSSDGGPCWRHR